MQGTGKTGGTPFAATFPRIGGHLTVQRAGTVVRTAPAHRHRRRIASHEYRAPRPPPLPARGTFSGATADGKPLGSWPLWTGDLADMSGVQEGTVSALSNGGRNFTAGWLSTG
ncbi:hypothetical protein BIV25_21010 [Streptomyces sp. MUSC 14]|uniref:hypothetical protein n=1 Tax=Streptomyces sp. MUSC 14 TaxID=1354889 RepID=UPI0008F5F1CA|nr:hypothetical protein [Streptomyces sp. MUSC 14]OIJ95107.1 hypothetical protein BIV25_21010 [Streptomyces sp. MUSC 14]